MRTVVNTIKFTDKLLIFRICYKREVGKINMNLRWKPTDPWS